MPNWEKFPQHLVQPTLHICFFITHSINHQSQQLALKAMLLCDECVFDQPNSHQPVS
jgi:hypothetical protein